MPYRTFARSALRAVLASPEPLLRSMLGELPRNDRGHELDLGVGAFLRGVAAQRPKTSSRPLAHLRHEMDHRAPLADFARCALHRVHERDVEIPGVGHSIPVRVYEPGPPTATPRPIVVYFHGGGFCIGSLRSHDGLCSRIARRADCIVVAVEYRLAPEHRFPAAVEDALAAFRWTAEHAHELGGDRHRVAVAGDSAGGNLAAVVAWHERGRDPRPCFQLLVYPVTDWAHDTESYRLFAEGFLHEADAMMFFRENYLGGCAVSAADPMASVLHAPCVRGAPRAHVVTAGFDPLRDEGERYARKLEAAGVHVDLQCEESLVHGFFSLGGILHTSRRAIDRAIDALARGMRA
ncbi:alpha/beta hydrolase [Sandaracinus amylolyticus]|nr:alpha/beta hydrolase [Sandaracinus amylolyticus]